MSKIWRFAKNYWLDRETYIFKNYIDAICGAIVLILLPMISLITVSFVSQPTWDNYLFPIVSIALAGAYDTYGRYEHGSPKNFKLGLRLIIDLIAMFLSALSLGINSTILRFAPSCILLFCGLTLTVEIFARIDTAIKLSPWYS